MMQSNGYVREIMYSSNKNLLNSVVLIQVIDKFDRTYKILVNGSVYQASLPLSIGKNESVLAKIKSLNPFVLQLDKLLDIEEISDKNLKSIKEKLGNFRSSKADSLLKKLIENNLPVIKSKFLMLVKYIEKTEINFEDPKYELLLKILWEPSNFADLTEKNINYFVYPIEELQNKICSFLIEKNNRVYKPAQIDELINILFTPAHDLKEKLIEEYKKFAKTDYNLLNWASKNLESDNDETAEAVKLILVYLFQKKFYERMELFPEFIIVDGEPPELVQFTVKKITKNSMNETYAVNFCFEQDDETIINSELLLNGQISNIHFPDSIVSGYSINALLKDLPFKIKNNLNLAVKVMLKNRVRYEIADSFTGINATV